jgi:hypothetical protein
VTIVLLLVADVIFFSIIWIELDTAITNIGSGHTDHIMAFLACILINPKVNQRGKCFGLGQKVLVNEQTCVALLLMLSVSSSLPVFTSTADPDLVNWYSNWSTSHTIKPLQVMG